MTVVGDGGLRALLEARLADALSEPAGTGVVRRADPSAPVPLSAAQRSMWLQAQYSPADPAYNVPLVLRLRGELNRAALLSAIDRLVIRHEILRSVVVVDADGEPATVVREADLVPVREKVIEERLLGEELHRELHRPFDLGRDAPLRAAVFRIGPRDHVLALTFHHIAADAYSRAAVVEDFSACYNAFARGQELPPAPRVQYLDHVAAGAAVADEDLAWWRERLAGLPPALDLPEGRLRALPPWTAGTVEVDLGDELTARLRATAAASGCTLFMVLLAGLDIVLAKACGTTDVIVGTPEAGRAGEDVRDLVGCFVNTLAIRTDLAGAGSAGEVLARVREASLDAFSHAGVPFERVVAALNPERDPRISPVFQVMLNVYDEPLDAALLTGLEVEAVDVPLTAAKFDLVWHVVDRGARGLHCSLVHRTDVVTTEVAERIGGWLRAVLEQLVADPATPIGEVSLEPLCTPSARGPRLPAPPPLPVHAEIERYADTTPHAVAVVAADGELTYRELDDWAGHIASRLHDDGVLPGQPVGILLDRGVRLAAAVLGVLKAGCCYVPLEPAYPGERIAALVGESGVRAVLCEAGAPEVPAHRIELGAPPRFARVPAPVVTVSPSDLAYVVHTSGSTGRPKGVAVEHRNLVSYLASLRRLIDRDAGQHASFALVSTFAADLGLTNFYGALTSGGTLHLVPREVSVDPHAYARYLAEHPVDVVKMVPSQLEMLAAHGDLAAVLPRRLLILAGEAVSWDLLDRVRAARRDLAVQVHYGPTETTVSVLGGPVHDIPVSQRGSVAPLGHPMSNVDCFVVDAADRPVPAGVAGELLVGGPGVSRGYLGRPDLTAEKFVADPLGGGLRCYRTGDRVRVRADGRLEFLGRLDDQVKIRGFRVELGEVLARVRALAEVNEAVVLPVGDGAARRLVAWVTGAGADPATIRARLRRELPDHMVPAAVVVLDSLPLNANGKVDRHALPLPETGPVSAPPATPAEQAVAAVWAELLGVEDVQATDDFFALGGDSFLALRAVRAIDPSLRLVDLLARPTVRALAELLDGRAGASRRLLHPLTPPAAMTLICLPYAGGTAAAYRPLADALRGRVAVVAAELPGHDIARRDEELSTWEVLAGRLADEVAAHVEGPVAVYGHSAGAALAVALTGELEDRGVPVAGVLAGAQLPVPRPPGPADDESYRRALRDAGGLTGDLDDEVQLFLARAARHDAEQARGWFSTARRRLRTPLTCVVGADDPGTESYADDHAEWLRTAEHVDLAVLPAAGHYFVKHQATELAALIIAALGGHAGGNP